MLRSHVLGLVLLALAACSGSEQPGWQRPVPFSPLHQGFQGGRLLAAADGRALLAWTEGAHVWSSSSADGVTWTAPEQVDDAAMRAGLAGVAMSGNGKAALVWRAEEADPADHFKVRLRSPSSGWVAGNQPVDGLTSDGSGGAVAVNDAGDVVAVSTRSGTGGHVWARTYAEASGWSAAATRLDADTGYSNYPDVALDAAGNATVVWEQWDGTRNGAFARRATAGAGWDAGPTPLDGAADPSADRVRIALGAGGDGLALWTLADASGVRARRLVGGAWQPVETVAEGTTIYQAEARVAPDGRIVVAWADGQDVRVRTFAGGAWDAAATLVSDDAETVRLRTWTLAMDRSHGRALVMWTRLALDDADGSAAWARRYDPARGWSPVEVAVPWTPGILFDVDDAVLLDDGRALAVLAGEDVSVWEYSTYLIGFR